MFPRLYGIFTPWMRSTLTWPSNQVGESKGTRLLRFSFVSGKDVCSLRGEWVVEKSTPRLLQVQLLQNYLESMENQVRSSGIFFAGLTSLEIFQRSTRIWMIDKQIQNTLKGESSSCQCSLTLMGQRKEILWTVFRLPRRYVIMQKDFSDDIGHSSVQEKKMSGIDCTLTQQTCAFAAHAEWPPSFFSTYLICAIPCSLSFALKKNRRNMWHKRPILWFKHFEESGHPIFRGISCVQPRNLEGKEEESTIHFSSESSNAKLVTSHNPLGKSAQYVRSSIEFVWRLRWKDFWSNIIACGQIYFKRERSVIVKVESARSGLLCKASWLRSPHGMCSLREGCRTCEEGVPALGVIQVRVWRTTLRDEMWMLWERH